MEHFQGNLLKEYTSFLVGGKAKDFYIPRSFEDVEELLKRLHTEGKDFYVLGKGSNVLISDEGLDAPVILIRENLSGIHFQSYKEYLEEKRKKENSEDIEDKAIFTALAGTSLSELAKYAEEKGYTGMEPLSGIPGTVGGAVKMNAGAYNSEIKDVFHHGTFCKRNGEIFRAFSFGNGFFLSTFCGGRRDALSFCKLSFKEGRTCVHSRENGGFSKEKGGEAAFGASLCRFHL